MVWKLSFFRVVIQGHSSGVPQGTGVCLWTSPFPYISVNNITEYVQSVFFVYIYDIYAVTDDKADKSLCEILETPEIIVEKWNSDMECINYNWVDNWLN
jgi:hypothetical protein